MERAKILLVAITRPTLFLTGIPSQGRPPYRRDRKKPFPRTNIVIGIPVAPVSPFRVALTRLPTFVRENSVLGQTAM